MEEVIRGGRVRRAVFRFSVSRQHKTWRGGGRGSSLGLQESTDDSFPHEGVGGLADSVLGCAEPAASIDFKPP
eukprot:2585866-Prymnesium_polylepis.1